ncbi:hypothetical protein [Dickeya fangzhongdai]|uniref:hypothetical protein n=1 Tax=Dickeya fangzhongdai TaxID=1778540 RepID=UPI000675BD9F|nr:hypothetical protein [Dickeya fangzhongdai]AYH46622.1 hypothetical protein B6N31_02265 [Dickeya fangzhongdai]MBO8135874.1 hypothetical protein [Dickeya fangzhongdai]UMB77251.1 hypothetical protein FXN80_02115 [Dickeya fangzhongdai]WES90667.1 hypothetical protein PQ617_09275 [Dickeya fangzhongdai]WPD77768.1 hypothetical protein OGM23_10720 [Dickeya fangzhongdai]
MTDTHATPTDSSINIFRDLIASLPFHQLDEVQLCDLGAIAAESVAGLCHGLNELGDRLQNGADIEPEQRYQLGASLNAAAHLIPALLEICEQAERHTRVVPHAGELIPLYVI